MCIIRLRESGLGFVALRAVAPAAMSFARLTLRVRAWLIVDAVLLAHVVPAIFAVDHPAVGPLHFVAALLAEVVDRLVCIDAGLLSI
jgi:hypothetical protein